MQNKEDIKKYPSISIVIPNWNGEKTLETTILSCLNQTLSPIEILVCDDGSIDDSKKIIENINDSRIVWIPGIHSGSPAGPRNRGLNIAKGEYIAFCDSDDEWLPTKLETQIYKLINTKELAICTNAFKKINNIVTKEKVVNFKYKNISFLDLLKSNDVVCSSALIHKSIFNIIGGFPEITQYGSYADYCYWLRVTTKTKFIFIDEPLVIYNDHPETSMRKEKISDIELKNNTFKNFKEWSIQIQQNNIYILLFKINIIKQKIKMFFVEKIWKQK